jgi:alanine dehydrogenase
MAIARLGWRDAVRSDHALAEGVNVVGGEITCAPVGEAHGLPVASLASVLD